MTFWGGIEHLTGVSALYYIIYFSFLMLSANDLKAVRYLREFCIFGVYIFLAAFVGFRYKSVDYDSYVEIFNRSNINNFSFPLFDAEGGTTGNEFIYATLNSVLNLLGADVAALFLLIALISIGIKFYFFAKISPYFFVSVLLFMSFSFFKELGQIRSALASSILLFAVAPLLERNLLKFLMVVLVAFGVHAYALVAVPIYFLYRFFSRGYVVYTLLITSLFVSVIGGFSRYIVFFLSTMQNEMAVKAVVYFEGHEDGIHYHALNISCFLFAFILYFCRSHLSRINKLSDPLIFFHIYATIVYFFTMDFPMVASRTIEMLSFTSLAILLPFLLKIVDKGARPLVAVGLVSYSALLFYAVSKSAEPYQSIFFGVSQ